MATKAELRHEAQAPQRRELSSSLRSGTAARLKPVPVPDRRLEEIDRRVKLLDAMSLEGRSSCRSHQVLRQRVPPLASRPPLPKVYAEGYCYLNINEKFPSSTAEQAAAGTNAQKIEPLDLSVSDSREIEPKEMPLETSSSANKSAQIMTRENAMKIALGVGGVLALEVSALMFGRAEPSVASQGQNPPTFKLSAVRSASPDLTESALSNERTKNQKAQGRAPSPAGFSIEGSRRRTQRPQRSGRPAGLRTSATSCRQTSTTPFACLSYSVKPSRWGSGIEVKTIDLSFLPWRNTARAVGKDPCRLFRSLLRKQLRRNVTHAAEDRARQRLREHHDQELERNCDQDRGGTFSIGEIIQPRSGSEASKRTPERRLSPDEEIVEKCIRLSKDRRVRVRDPFQIARQVKGWTRDQWDVAHLSYRVTQSRQTYCEEEFEIECASFGRAV